MNNIEYINALKSALAIKEDDRKAIEQYQKMALDNSNNVKFKTIVGLLGFHYLFFKPLFQVITVIIKRINEDNVDDWDISKNSYTLMTIESVFKNMTQDISPEMACDTIIDKHLDCNPYAKSELKRSIKECNLQLFKDTIKEYNINYKPASDYCSHLCFVLNMQKPIDNSIEKCIVSFNPEALSTDEINLYSQATLEDWKSNIINICKEDGCSDEDINELKKEIEFSLDFSSINTFSESLSICTLISFRRLVNSINDYAKEELLNYYDKHLIGNFIEKKKAEMPIVQCCFNLFTKGDIFGDDFVFMEIHHTEFLKIIEQCVSIETNEQQMLLDNKNIGICNNEQVVANPKFEELPLPSILACDEEKAREIIMRAIKKGYMELIKVEGHYKYNWTFDTRSTLVYFCGRLCMGDYTESKTGMKKVWHREEATKSETGNKNKSCTKKSKFPRKPLSQLFLYNGKPTTDVNYGYRSRNDIYSPDESEKVDELFE